MRHPLRHHTPRNRFAAASLAAKLGAVGLVLMLLALGSIALTLSVTWRLEGGAAAVNEAGRLRMQTWRLAQSLQAPGDVKSRHALLLQQAQGFEAGLALLRQGDPQRPLFLPADDRTRLGLAQVQQRWQQTRQSWLGANPPTAADAAAQAQSLVLDIDQLVRSIEAQLARLTSLLSLFQLGLMGLALAAGVALVYCAHLFIFNPLRRLRTGLARVEQADFSARVAVDSPDEFGQVAQGFNRMASTMQDFYASLENKVLEKTQALHAQRERLTQLYDASRFVARTDSLEALAQGFAQRLRQAGGADAAMLRWYDSAQQRHVLLASDCLPAAMLEEEHCIRVGDCHCGQAEADLPARVIRIQPLTSPGALSGAACERFGFSSVVTVPICFREQLLGEADLLYRGHAVSLQDETRTLLESLAAHMASGMEGVRAAALEREAAVAEERSLLARELHDSIAQGLAFLKIQVQLLRQARQRGEAAPAERAVQELEAGIGESMADVRELLLHFRTRINDGDIVPALKQTLRKFEHQFGIDTHLEVLGNGVPLPADVQVQVLHVMQEALSNVRKHAQASQVWLTVHQQPCWEFELKDDGRGFAVDVPLPDDETHVGLRIMRERASSIQARLQVQASTGQGTRVVITLPPQQGHSDLQEANAQPLASLDRLAAPPLATGLGARHASAAGEPAWMSA